MTWPTQESTTPKRDFVTACCKCNTSSNSSNSSRSSSKSQSHVFSAPAQSPKVTFSRAPSPSPRVTKSRFPGPPAPAQESQSHVFSAPARSHKVTFSRAPSPTQESQIHVFSAPARSPKVTFSRAPSPSPRVTKSRFPGPSPVTKSRLPGPSPVSHVCQGPPAHPSPTTKSCLHSVWVAFGPTQPLHGSTRSEPPKTSANCPARHSTQETVRKGSRNSGSPAPSTGSRLAAKPGQGKVWEKGRGRKQANLQTTMLAHSEAPARSR